MASEGQKPGLLLTVRALSATLNEQEQKVAAYVLAHPEEVIYLSLSRLADRCGVSDATVFRFARRVGSAGYQDFKIRLAQELAIEHSPVYAPISAVDSLIEAAQKVIQADMKALEDTLTVLELPTLEKVADRLLTARCIDIYGSGGAAVAALELQYKLIRVGVRGVAHTDAEMQLISATLLTEADAAVGISHSGRATDTLHALRVAKEAGATLIAITNHPASPIAKLADLSLCTGAQESLAHGYPLGARVAQVGLIDILYTCMALKRAEETERRLAQVAGTLYAHFR